MKHMQQSAALVRISLKSLRLSPPALSQETTAVAVPDVADAAYSNNREAM